MKYIKNKEDFTNQKKSSTPSINEEFDMSGGGGGGPLSNSINWGDSLIGRLLNSTFRMTGLKIDNMKINNVIDAIKKEFEKITFESKAENSNIDKSDINTIEISFFMEKLTESVFSGRDPNILIYITEETIDIIENSEIDDSEKREAIEELEKFMEFIKKYKKDDIEKEPGEIVDLSYLRKIR